MKRTLTALGALLLTTGCGINEEKFALKYAEETCSLAEQCSLLDLFGGTYDECVTLVEASQLAVVTSSECVYDAAAAKACIDESKDATCDGDTTGTASATAGSSSCDAICGSGLSGGNDTATQ